MFAEKRKNLSPLSHQPPPQKNFFSKGVKTAFFTSFICVKYLGQSQKKEKIAIGFFSKDYVPCWKCGVEKKRIMGGGEEASSKIALWGGKRRKRWRRRRGRWCRRIWMRRRSSWRRPRRRWRRRTRRRRRRRRRRRGGGGGFLVMHNPPLGKVPRVGGSDNPLLCKKKIMPPPSFSSPNPFFGLTVAYAGPLFQM